jgi:hypothetical protein
MGRTCSTHVRGEKRFQKLSQNVLQEEITRLIIHSSDNIIKMDVTYAGCEKMGWIQLAYATNP